MHVNGISALIKIKAIWALHKKNLFTVINRLSWCTFDLFDASISVAYKPAGSVFNLNIWIYHAAMPVMCNIIIGLPLQMASGGSG